MSNGKRYSSELRERAVRMVFEHEKDHDSQWGAIRSISEKVGMSRCGASTALGVMGLAREGDERALGVANLLVGAASVWVAYQAATRRTRIDVHPWIEPGGDVGDAGRPAPLPRTGVRLRITF